MERKLLSIALAGLPLMAMADVTIYGYIKGGLEDVKDKANVDITHVADMGSFIGFRGNEDLGGGTKAIWQVESRFRLDGQSGPPKTSGLLGSRQSFIGAEGDWGRVRLGNLFNYGYKDMEIINPWQSETNSLQLYHFTAVDTLYKNSIRYDSPDLAGVDVTLMHSFDETAGVKHDVDNIGLGYSKGPVVAKYQFQRQNGGSQNHPDQFHRFEATYSSGNWLIGAGYSHNIIYDAQDSKLVAKDVAATVTYTLGALVPKFSYDHGFNVSQDGHQIGNTSYNQYIAGVDYLMSKRTSLGVSYGKIRTSADNVFCNSSSSNPNFFISCAKESAIGVQLRHHF